MSRKLWIDNVRILCILLLFPFHAVMIFNDFGESWYINTYECTAASMFNFSVYPWWMSGLFALAGVSTVYALKKRSIGQYAKERFRKLFIPFVSGLILVVPVQTYLADKFHNGYSGNYFQHFRSFFTVTDFSGADGCFTPGQLWFILYLFLISMISLPLISWYEKRTKHINGAEVVGWKLLLIGIIPSLVEPLADIGGKSVTEFWGWFLIGYFILSLDEVQVWIKKYRTVWFGIVIFIVIIRCILYKMHMGYDLFWDSSTAILQWFGILTILAVGMCFLNREMFFTDYFSKAAFPVYIFHQSWIVIVGYAAALHLKGAMLQYVLIVVFSFIFTMITYEIARRFRLTGFLFGIKNK